MSRELKGIIVAIVILAGLGLYRGFGSPVHAQTSAGFGYTNISTAASTVVVSAGGITLHTVTINGGTTGAVSLFDNGAACSTTSLGVIQAATAPVTLTYDLILKNGLCITTAANTNVTVTVR